MPFGYPAVGTCRTFGWRVADLTSIAITDREARKIRRRIETSSVSVRWRTVSGPHEEDALTMAPKTLAFAVPSESLMTSIAEELQDEETSFHPGTASRGDRLGGIFPQGGYITEVKIRDDQSVLAWDDLGRDNDANGH